MICLGWAYSIASIVKSGDGSFCIKPILNNLVHSIPLMTYIFMTILGFCNVAGPPRLWSLRALWAMPTPLWPC